MVMQAALGLAVSGLYPEQTWAVAAFRGNDLVTLLLAAPVLAVAMLASRRRESSASVLVWLGMLHYGVYNYAYYAFGAAFSSAFLVHVAALVASIGGLLMLATSLDAGPGGTRRRGWHPVAGGRRLHHLRGARAGRRMGRPLRCASPSPARCPRTSCRRPPCTSSTRSTCRYWRRCSWWRVCCSGGASRGVRCWPSRSTRSGAVYLAVLWAVGGFQADAGIPGTTWAVTRGDRVGARLPGRPRPCWCTPTPRNPAREDRPAHVELVKPAATQPATQP